MTVGEGVSHCRVVLLSLPYVRVSCCRYAFYAMVMCAVYVIGLPLVVFTLLYRRRHKLFGDPSDPFVSTTVATFGFLYEVRNRRAACKLQLAQAV